MHPQKFLKFLSRDDIQWDYIHMIYEILAAKNPYAKELDIAIFREPPSTKDAKNV